MNFSRIAAALSALALSTLTAPAQAFVSSVDTLFPSLVEGKAIPGYVQLGISPEALTLSQDTTVKVYFIDEGAGYRNTFGWYDANAGDPTQAANRNVIWANASKQGGGGSLVSGSEAVVGDFSAGTELGFFVSANGYSYEQYRGRLSDERVDAYMDSRVHTYYTNDALNPDGISHVVAGVLPEQGLLTLGFEDLYGGGDRDYDDVVFAIDIGVENATKIAAGAPEPGEWALMIVGTLTLMGLARRRPDLIRGLSPIPQDGRLAA